MREMKDSGTLWIGEIPKEWEIIRMKNMIVSREGGAWGEEKANNENDVICLRIADFDYSRLRFKDSNQLTIRNYKPEIKKRLLLSQDDILLEKSGGGEKTPVGRAVIFDKKYEALFANFMERLRTNKNTNPKYFLYILTAFYQNKHMLNYIKQTTGIQNLDINSLLSIEYSSFPPLVEQQKISVYLDTKCTKIDSIIEKQEKVIEKLKEYKLSVITEAVTKGLNPDVNMKDSGVEWIVEIPEHWNTAKIKYNFKIISGATPKSEKVEYWNGEINWITPADFKTDDVYIDNGRKSITKAGYDSCGATLVPANSIIFSKRAPIGNVVISSDILCTNQGCLACISKKEVSIKYFYFTMSAFTEQFNLYGTGTTFKEISTKDFSNFILPLPQLNEQKQIADYLDKKCSAIDKSIEQKQAIIEKLKEYKKSLIYEVVTGKKEV